MKRGPLFFLCLIGLLLAVFVFAETAIHWHSGKDVHTILEVGSALLALLVGSTLLIHANINKSLLYTILGAGFLGASFLDAYHSLVTSKWFDFYWSSPPHHLIPWSWSGSRMLLATMILSSTFAWNPVNNAGRIVTKEHIRFLSVAVISIVLSCFLFFALVPLPPAYYPNSFFGRPQELVAGVIFFAALIKFFRRGLWRHDAFDFWIVISLILAVFIQMFVMPLSHRLFDAMFDVAHILKCLSYLSVMIGVSLGTLKLAEKVRGNSEVLGEQRSESAEVQRKISEANEIYSSRMEKLSGELNLKTSELEHLNELATVRELRMIELKKEVNALSKRLGVKPPYPLAFDGE